MSDLLAELDDDFFYSSAANTSRNNHNSNSSWNSTTEQGTTLGSQKNISTVPPSHESSSKSNKSNVEVLFDATIDDDGPSADAVHYNDEEEDFGDFETGDDNDVEKNNHTTTTRTHSSGAKKAIGEEEGGQLLDLGFEYSVAPPAAPAPARSSIPELFGKESQQHPIQTIDLLSSTVVSVESSNSSPEQGSVHHQKNLITQEDDDDDEWGDFVGSQEPTNSDPSGSKVEDIHKNTDRITQHQTTQPSPPPPYITTSNSQTQTQTLPTNIPPPSHLLPLFHPLLTPTQTPSPTHLLKHILVLSHILSGRRLRWKRDMYLSSSYTLTSLPTSQTSKSQGLKLQHLTPNEQAHENREVSEIVETWRQNAGWIRGAMRRSLPDIKENMMVRSLGGGGGGGMVAGKKKKKKSCLLCGLWRDERVVGVHCAEDGVVGGEGDGEGGLLFRVEDSFGEWWVEDRGWFGHVVCRKFWEEMRGVLISR